MHLPLLQYCGVYPTNKARLKGVIKYQSCFGIQSSCSDIFPIRKQVVSVVTYYIPHLSDSTRLSQSSISMNVVAAAIPKQITDRLTNQTFYCTRDTISSHYSRDWLSMVPNSRTQHASLLSSPCVPALKSTTRKVAATLSSGLWGKRVIVYMRPSSSGMKDGITIDSKLVYRPWLVRTGCLHPGRISLTTEIK